jgi:hypothetical protein
MLGWLPQYDRSWLTVDVLAGLTLWGLVVPEAMAYAGIAGHPEPAAGIEQLLGQEEAVAAVQVTGRASGLGQEVKGGRGIVWELRHRPTPARRLDHGAPAVGRAAAG